ncbi:hypothetical protein AGOR_G00238570 [Albula goreensis]|uniref:Uncharacterized protein n=1 Tax=Albula goreensis TaxID=1534307 RepID=A0A8T3CHF6_9TELE|nr:hypothetical protein AGOR_G00238570 [Albula goreensis]
MMERPGSCRPRPTPYQLAISPPFIGSPAGMKVCSLWRKKTEQTSGPLRTSALQAIAGWKNKTSMPRGPPSA